MNRTVLSAVGGVAVLSTVCAAGPQQSEGAAATAPIGPRDAVGPDVPLTEVEKAKFAQRVTVEGRTDEAVKEACEPAVKEGVSVVFLPAGEYIFETTMTNSLGLAEKRRN